MRIGKIAGCIFIAFSLIGCGVHSKVDDHSVNAVSKLGVRQVEERDWLVEEVNHLEGINYKSYIYPLLDTYFIACGLYFDFNSAYIMPNVEKSELYREAKVYFEPYKDHRFIKNLGDYIDKQNKDADGGVVYPLMMYAISERNYGIGVDHIQTNAFEDGEAFNQFLEELKAFYKDSDAESFFKSQQTGQSLKEYLNETVDMKWAENLFKEMEDELGVGTITQPPTAYVSFLTVYRPNMGSFYTMWMGNDCYFVAQQSPNGSNRNPELYDVNKQFSTAIHEFLHQYINEEVARQGEQIAKLTEGKSKKDYASPLYQNMEWSRIVDENLVRVIETHIFAKCYNDEAKAIEEILSPEVQYGFKKGKKIYEALKEYEANSEANVMEAIPHLIEVMFEA